MRRIAALALACLAVIRCAGSELVLTRMRVSVTENFDGFLGTYDSLPEGFSVSKDGCVVLCSTNTTDFRGVHSGGTIEGACLAWDLGAGNHALGYQPTEEEFTPGFFLLTLSNGTGHTIGRMDVSYEVVCYNNENRSSSMDLEYSCDGTTFVSSGVSCYTTPSIEDPVPVWSNCCYSFQVEFPRTVAVGSCIWLRWLGDDAGGTGSRDEYGIDNVRVTPRPAGGTVISVR